MVQSLLDKKQADQENEGNASKWQQKLLEQNKKRKISRGRACCDRCGDTGGGGGCGGD